MSLRHLLGSQDGTRKVPFHRGSMDGEPLLVETPLSNSEDGKRVAETRAVRVIFQFRSIKWRLELEIG